MKEITEFIKLSREERRLHLDLNTECCERGGNSTNHKGVLAEFLETTIPSGRILLCHACNNAKCSNPKHLYWGTDYDNIVIDGKEFGTHKSIWDRVVEKHGLEEAKRINKHSGDPALAGRGNKGKQKSEIHKQKISEGLKRAHVVKLANTRDFHGTDIET